VPANQVIVLPNSANVIMAAERAAELSEKSVAVLETRWPQIGLACLVGHDPDGHLELNLQRLRGALDGIRAGSVAAAARDDKKGRFKAGEAVGFVDEEIVAWGKPDDTVRSVLERLADDAELLTVVAGVGAPLDADAIRQLAPPGIELDLHEGGQPHYWWLVAAE
jgi:dihydroxyacetone kinase-like predicted kinase